MATLQLTKVWINRLPTGQAVSAQSSPARARLHEIAGEVRTYAGGRQRAITTAGERGSFTFTVVDVSLATIDTLRSWVALPVQVRDHRGQRFFGVFFAVTVTEARESNLYDVTMDLRVVTVAEGV